MTKPIDTRVSKNILNFGRVSIYRRSTVPRMDEGRNGDLVLIDTEPTQADPDHVGLWMKIPLTDNRAPSGTVVTGIPGATSEFPTITINTVVVTFIDPGDIDGIVDDINTAAIPDITAAQVGGAVQLMCHSGGAITVSENSLGLYSLPELSAINTKGVWAPFLVSESEPFAQRAVNTLIEAPEDKTYTLFGYAVFEFQILYISAKTEAGNINVAVQVNGIDVTGLENVLATTIRETTDATGNNNVFIGDIVSIVTSNNNGAFDLVVTIAYQYRV